MSQLSPEAKRLMELAREAYTPDAQRATQVHDALMARIASDLGADAIGVVGASAVGFWRASRLVGIAVVAVGFVTGAMLLRANSNEQSIAAASATAAPINVANVTDVVAAAPGAQMDVTPVPNADRTQLVPAPRTAANEVQHATAQKRPARSLHARRLAPAHTEHHAAANIAEPRPAHTASANGPSRRPATAQPSNTRAVDTTTPKESDPTVAATSAQLATDARVQAAKPAAPTDDAFQRELALVKRANAALARHDADSALRSADEHASSFPTGRLVQERVAVRALALCALGRNAEARNAAQELEHMAARSPHLMRLREACPATQDVQALR